MDCSHQSQKGTRGFSVVPSHLDQDGEVRDGACEGRGGVGFPCGGGMGRRRTGCLHAPWETTCLGLDKHNPFHPCAWPALSARFASAPSPLAATPPPWPLAPSPRSRVCCGMRTSVTSSPAARWVWLGLVHSNPKTNIANPEPIERVGAGYTLVLLGDLGWGLRELGAGACGRLAEASPQALRCAWNAVVC